MTWLVGPRIAALGLLAAALVGLWQASLLESWSFDGPGAGFFPQAVAAACVALAALVFCFPGRAAQAGDADAGETPEAAGSGRTFAVYAAAFLLLAAGASYAGFGVTAVVVTVVIVRFAEGRSWLVAAGYGVACAVVGLVCFGWLLRVDLPQGAIDRMFFGLVR
jgi:cobalamin synthase